MSDPTQTLVTGRAHQRAHLDGPLRRGRRAASHRAPLRRGRQPAPAARSAGRRSSGAARRGARRRRRRRSDQVWRHRFLVGLYGGSAGPGSAGQRAVWRAVRNPATPSL
jgi:hypothetical protein